MMQFFNRKFVIALLFGAGIAVLTSVLLQKEEFEGDHLYGEPDGEVSEAEIPSFVD